MKGSAFLFGLILPFTSGWLSSVPTLKVSMGALSMGPEIDDFDFECDEDEDGECEIDWDNMPTDSTDDLPSNMRQRLEMAWRIEETKEECDVEDPPSCDSQVCESCEGMGRRSCRFCHGEKVFAGHACPLCDTRGTEICRSCQGTGWIAQWTLLSESTVPNKS